MTNIASECRNANIVRDHATILPDDATPKPDGIFGKDSVDLAFQLARKRVVDQPVAADPRLAGELGRHHEYAEMALARAGPALVARMHMRLVESRLFDLNGETDRVSKRQKSAIIAVDVRRFGHAINTDEVFGTHSRPRMAEWAARAEPNATDAAIPEDRQR